MTTYNIPAVLQLLATAGAIEAGNFFFWFTQQMVANVLLLSFVTSVLAKALYDTWHHYISFSWGDVFRVGQQHIS